jgi:hypothetical protein
MARIRINSLNYSEVEPPLLKISTQQPFVSISSHLDLISCAAAFPTGYGPRGDTFALTIVCRRHLLTV